MSSLAFSMGMGEWFAPQEKEHQKQEKEQKEQDDHKNQKDETDQKEQEDQTCDVVIDIWPGIESHLTEHERTIILFVDGFAELNPSAFLCVSICLQPFNIVFYEDERPICSFNSKELEFTIKDKNSFFVTVQNTRLAEISYTSFIQFFINYASIIVSMQMFLPHMSDALSTIAFPHRRS